MPQEQNKELFHFDLKALRQIGRNLIMHKNWLVISLTHNCLQLRLQIGKRLGNRCILFRLGLGRISSDFYIWQLNLLIKQLKALSTNIKKLIS